MDATYKVENMPGVAWRLRGYLTQVVVNSEYDTGDDVWYYDTEEVENYDVVIGVMVGDDRRYELDVDELTIINEDDYCLSCGQIGCGH